ncbi:MAG: DNA polymerase IV [Candidatus Margulisiibacteriota bacterium]|nr:MAG: DNA polymerase IV [Candidatus Margulisiibacteriota bacterium]
MRNQPLTISSWPTAILHADGDGFFASVEQALNPAYKNKPVVTGHERGMAIAVSYEAKALGITRGMLMNQIRRTYPECIILPGNYEAYMLFAKRMFSIMRRYTPAVEEYSIDEAFADITGLRRVHNLGYEEIARKIQSDIRKELDIGVSIGVSLTKSLAKLCSKFRKPNGITCVKGKYIHILLQKTPIEKVWGIGPSTSSLLRKYQCTTAYDFVMKPVSFINHYLTKRELEIYKELRGEMVFSLDLTKKDNYQSISKARTFEATKEKSMVFAEMVKNIEEATAKCRKYKLTAKRVSIFFKTQQFVTSGHEAKLSRHTASAIEILEVVKVLFDHCYKEGVEYRQTTCVLSELTDNNSQQLTIFDSVLRIEQLEKVSGTVDAINKNMGRGKIHLAASLPARKQSNARLAIPMMNIRV